MVTDDRGRYLVPDLPKANYSVWVRGYGLVDSAKVQAAPGKTVNLTAVLAPDAKAAAEYYPASYWYSLLKVAGQERISGHRARRATASRPNMKSQAQWLEMIKTDSCWSCHQLGNKATREIPEELGQLRFAGEGVGAAHPIGAGGRQHDGRHQPAWARSARSRCSRDWTNRIAAGELPPAPPRPQGVERNVVITEWDWAEPEGLSAR